MTALFVSYSGLLGGAERVLLDAAAALDTPAVLTCPEGLLAERARRAGLPVFALRERPLELRGGGPRRRAEALAHLAAFRHEVRAIVDSLRPEVVVAWGMRAGLAVLSGSGLATGGRHEGPRVVFTHHDLLPGPAIARAVRAAARRADVVVATSDCTARELGVPATVIRPGVELNRFSADPPPAGPPEVLVLGAITAWKRPGLALEVIARASRELPDLRVRLAGEPIDESGVGLLAELRRRADQPDLAGRVEFAGAVDAAEALRRAHCLLHCADREPFGVVLVEAMAAGRPVVAPAACGPLEIVAGDSGRLYPPGDEAAAAHALVDALARRHELGRAGRAHAEAEFAVADTRTRYRELIADGAGERSPQAADLALVTVTHNSERDLPALLASAERHLPGARMVVVDSASSDHSAELARAAGATVIEVADNVGFGRASNLGVAAVAEHVTVLVNPDVELLDDSLLRLADDLRGGRPERLLAPLVLLPDGRRQDAAQAEPASLAALAVALVPPVAMPRPLRRAVCPWTDQRPRRTGWAIGACVVAPTATLRRLGPFDERIFLYAEDLDLGLRAADAGIETWFRPDARVLHRGAHSSTQAFRGEPFELLARQRRAVVAKRRGRTRAALDDLLQAVTFADRIALKRLARRDTTREREQLKALRRARHGGGA